MPGFNLISDALVAVRTDQAEDDPLNALTVRAGLAWREVALVRAYLSATFQMRLAPGAAVDVQSSNGDGKGTSAVVLHDAAKAAQLRDGYLDQCAAVDNIG